MCSYFWLSNVGRHGWSLTGQCVNFASMCTKIHVKYHASAISGVQCALQSQALNSTVLTAYRALRTLSRLIKSNENLLSLSTCLLLFTESGSNTSWIFGWNSKPQDLEQQLKNLDLIVEWKQLNDKTVKKSAKHGSTTMKWRSRSYLPWEAFSYKWESISG